MGIPQTFTRAGEMWPGNNLVDWISWEAYNQGDCQSGTIDPATDQSFTDSMLPFFRWLHANAEFYHIDIHKPMMISESGTVSFPGKPAKTAYWYRQIPTVLRRYPSIKAIGLWDHTGTGSVACDFRFTRNRQIVAAVRRAGRDPYVKVG
jgi:hypothetical protein